MGLSRCRRRRHRRPRRGTDFELECVRDREHPTYVCLNASKQAQACKSKQTSRQRQPNSSQDCPQNARKTRKGKRKQVILHVQA